MEEAYAREPCPWRIVEDAGAAFSMGCIGGSLFQGVKGFYTAPKGFNRRLAGSWSLIRMRAPAIGASFGAWGLTFSTCDCTMVHLRQKEDALNSIMSGGFTGAILSVRHGPVAMAGGAIVGAILLGLIEGVGVLFSRTFSNSYQPMSPMDAPSPDSAEANMA